MILRPRKKQKNTVDSGAGVGTRSYGTKNIFYARDGVQVRERKLGDRVLYSAEARSKWLHPWHTTVGWCTEESGKLKNNRDEAIAGFAAIVNPGFVNGVDPVCIGAQKIKVGEVEKDSGDLLGGGSSTDLLAEAGLLDGPLVPLYGASLVTRKGGIPAGLSDLGAVAYTGGLSVKIEEVPPDPRYLAATDIYLQCARPTAEMDVTTSNYPMDSIEYNTTFNTSVLDRLGVRASLRVGSMPPNLKPTILDKFSGGYTDLGIDCWLIATVYFLSPENPIVDGNGAPELNEAWVPYVQHHTFWNLEYRWKLVVPVNKPAKLDMSLLPLVGRYTLAGQGMLAAEASELNRLVAAILNAKNTEGRFWTI